MEFDENVDEEEKQIAQNSVTEDSEHNEVQFISMSEDEEQIDIDTITENNSIRRPVRECLCGIKTP